MMNEKTKLLKTKTGMSLKDLAEQLEYNRTTLCLVCRGRIKPSKSLANKLAKMCGVDISYFLEA